MKLSRYWMTGCMALVLLVAGRGPSPGLRAETDAEQDTERRGWVLAKSMGGTDDTVKHLQAMAQRFGLTVLADLADKPVRDLAHRSNADKAPGRVLVLGHADGLTPMVQGLHDGAWELPLKVWLQALPDGTTRVAYSNPARLYAATNLPDDIRQALVMLPDIVAAATVPASTPSSTPSLTAI